MDSIIFPFTLKRSDGEERELFFEPEPNWILIKATTIDEGRVTPRITDHDRFDFNKREHDVWATKMWIWLKKEMEKFSYGMLVRAYYLNPYYAIGGFCP